MVTASPAKLQNGSWGARVAGSVKAGDSITIKTAAGKSWTAVVEKIVWSGNGVSIVATKSSNDYTPAVRNSRGYVTERGHESGYCGYNCPVSGKKCCSKNGQCHDCQ